MVARAQAVVLVAHEDEKIRSALAGLVKKAGARAVASAGAPKGAWKGLVSGKVHAAFLSWGILSAGKFAILRNRKTNDTAAGVGMVVVFGEKTAPELDKLLKSGVNGYITSPYDAKSIGKALEIALDSGSPAAGGNKKAVAKKHFMQGYGMLKQERYEEAMESFVKAVENYDLFPEAYKGAAKASREQGDDENAGRYLHKAAETCVVMERDDEAEDLYNAVMNITPEAEDPFKTAANRLREGGKLDRAARAYERAFEHSPKDDEVAASLSRTYMDMGEQEKAEEFLKELLGMEGEFPLAAETFLDITGESFYGKAVDEDAGTMQILGEQKGAKAGPNTRGAARLPMADLSMRIAGHKDFFSVVDASVTGIGFKPMSGEFKVGDKIKFDMIAMGDAKLKKLVAVVRRSTDTVVGCEYVKLSGKQRKILTEMFGEDTNKKKPEKPKGDDESLVDDNGLLGDF